MGLQPEGISSHFGQSPKFTDACVDPETYKRQVRPNESAVIRRHAAKTRCNGRIGWSVLRLCVCTGAAHFGSRAAEGGADRVFGQPEVGADLVSAISPNTLEHLLDADWTDKQPIRQFVRRAVSRWTMPPTMPGPSSMWF
jgi:hypothetical protein